MTEKTQTTNEIPTRDQLVEDLRNSVLEVTFIKLTGDRRVMTCTLMPELLPAPKKDEPLSQKQVRKIDPQVVSVWDLKAKGWRAFRYERLEAVELSDWLLENQQ